LKFPIYKDKNQGESLRKAKLRIAELETQPLADNKAEIVAHVHNMMEATSAVGPKSYGGFKKGTLSTIDEDTNAAVVAHTQFEDPFGNGIPITSPFISGRISLPLSDDEGRTAWYHGYYNPVVNRLNMSWAYNPPVVAHTSLHMMSRAFELNIPGSSGFDKDAFVYYASNAVFNISGSVSHALWFYPGEIAETSEVFSFLQWRYIDASNWYALVMKNSNRRIQCHVREAGVTTKIEVTSAAVASAWNLAIWTFIGSTNALALEVNNSTTGGVPTETLTVPYTTDANMYLGNIPNNNIKRFEGYLGQYVSWSIALSTTQRDNFFLHGTIV
jgi:hypothetical protein